MYVQAVIEECFRENSIPCRSKRYARRKAMRSHGVGSVPGRAAAAEYCSHARERLAVARLAGGDRSLSKDAEATPARGASGPAAARTKCVARTASCKLGTAGGHALSVQRVDGAMQFPTSSSKADLRGVSLVISRRGDRDLRLLSPIYPNIAPPTITITRLIRAVGQDRGGHRHSDHRAADDGSD